MRAAIILFLLFIAGNAQLDDHIEQIIESNYMLVKKHNDEVKETMNKVNFTVDFNAQVMRIVFIDPEDDKKLFRKNVLQLFEFDPLCYDNFNEVRQVFERNSHVVNFKLVCPSHFPWYKFMKLGTCLVVISMLLAALCWQKRCACMRRRDQVTPVGQRRRPAHL